MLKNYVNNLVINNGLWLVGQNNLVNASSLSNINFVINIHQTLIFYIGSHVGMNTKILLIILLFI